MLQAVRQVGLSGYVNTSYPRGLLAHGGGSAGPLRGHRRGHELGQVPRRRAAAGAAAGAPSSTAPRSPGWARDLEQTGAIMPDALERTAAAITRHGRRGEARRRAGDRRRRHGRPAHREQLRRRARGDPARERASTIEVISGEDESRLAYLAAASSLGVASGTVGRVRHRRRQLAVHFRRRAPASTSASASTSAPSATRSGSAWTGGSAEVRRGRGAWRRSAPTCRASMAARSPTRWSGMGGAVTNITAVKHGISRLRPRRRPGHGPGPGRDRSPDQDVP